ncbi:hypothetical protein BIW11_03529 [Tropilaelaps mercedesae]|uniref:Uncharacterized protein n=1 Tax=Tropilaelaps mercedesae TaxID=418985 RepID=A0A1V9XJH7_9ACAR|nr:hypothetical protein BIW11_03529 [Tropilaelaps mercedesae]
MSLSIIQRSILSRCCRAWL